jgi:hypothetical protein
MVAQPRCSPEPRDAATPKRPLSPSASAFASVAGRSHGDGRPAPEPLSRRVEPAAPQPSRAAGCRPSTLSGNEVRLGLRPKGARPRVRPLVWSLHSPRVAAAASKGHHAQPARREDELGPPGLLRRFPSVGVTPAAPTPHRAVPPRLQDPTQGSRPPTARRCVRLRRCRSDHRQVAAPLDHPARRSITQHAGLRRAARGCLRGGRRGGRGCRAGAHRGSDQRHPVRVTWWAAGPGGAPRQRRHDPGVGAGPRSGPAGPVSNRC